MSWSLNTTREMYHGDRSVEGLGKFRSLMKGEERESAQVNGNMASDIHLSNPFYSHDASLVKFLGELWFGKPLTYRELQNITLKS